MKDETKLIHSGYETEPTTHAVATPIYQTVAYEFDSAQHGADLFDLENNNTPGPTPIPGTVDAWNNIFEFAGSSRIGALNRSGTVNFNGVNLLYTDTLTIFAESDAFANFENAGNDPDTQLKVLLLLAHS